jgi:hypothetical protein
MTKLHLPNYQRVVTDISEIERPALLKLVGELIDALGFDIIVEETPDYTAYELRRRP